MKGWCPFGCGETLRYNPGAADVTCSAAGCPNPAAVTAILADRETGHVVWLRGEDFTVRHPLRERLDDALLTCAVTEECAMRGWVVPAGKYRVNQDVHGSWCFTGGVDE